MSIVEVKTTEQIIVKEVSPNVVEVNTGPPGPVGPAGPMGSLSDGDKGDIVVSASGVVWTIDPALLSAFMRGVTASSDEAAFKAAVNLEIGVDVQAYNAGLTTWAGKTAPAGTVVGTTDAQTLTNKAITAPTGIVADDIVDTASAHKFVTAAQKAKIDFITITQAVDLDDIETRVNALDAAVVLKGSWDASAGTFPGGGTAQAGFSYIVSVAGTVGGVAFNVGDRIIAILDNASTTVFAANWFKADYTDQVLSVASKTGAVTLQVADITDMSANARSLAQAANYAAMKTLLAYTVAEITDMSANGRSLVQAANYAAMKTLLGLTIGTNVQAWDAGLDAFAALATSANKGLYFTGSDVPALFDITSVARTFLAASTMLTQRSSIGLATGFPEGRLTLATGVPVMTTTQSAKTTIYYTPYIGDSIPIYDGTNMVETVFAELSVATTDTAKNPAAIGASKVNDWFVWNDAGTLRISHGPDWTSDTARSAGTALLMVKGLWLNNAAITNGPAASRGTYVGTTRSNASSQLEWIIGGSASGGTAGALHVWNMYNRRNALGQATDSAAHTYSSGTIRQFGGSAGMQVSFVIGIAEEPVQWTFKNEMTSTAVAGSRSIVGVGFDTTTAFSWPRTLAQDPVATAYSFSMGGTGPWSPAIGRHVLSFNEQGDGTNANELNNSLSASIGLLMAA